MRTVTVQKEVLEDFVDDLEKLLADFEKLLDNSLEIEAEQRLHEIKNNEVKMLNESGYQKFMKKMGIKNQ